MNLLHTLPPPSPCMTAFSESHSASPQQQKAMDQLFASQPCEIIVDDVLVWGASDAEHDAHAQQVLNRACEISVQPKADKCKIHVKNVGCVGHRLTDSGLTYWRLKESLPCQCQSVRALQCFLGIVKYLAKFISLRELIRKESNGMFLCLLLASPRILARTLGWFLVTVPTPFRSHMIV